MTGDVPKRGSKTKANCIGEAVTTKVLVAKEVFALRPHSVECRRCPEKQQGVRLQQQGEDTAGEQGRKLFWLEQFAVLYESW